MPKQSASKLAADAQAFIDSVKAFQTPERVEKHQPTLSTQLEAKDKQKEQASLEPKEESLPPERFVPIFEKRDAAKPNFWPKLELTDFRKEAITFIETFYFANNKLPNLSDFVQKFPANLLPKTPSDWEDFLVNIQEPLQARGLPYYETPPQYLEPNFVLAVNLVVNAYDKRTVPAKLKEAGLTTKQWTAFLRNQDHQEYFQKRLNAIFDDDMIAESKLAIMRLIQANDLQAVKYYNELQNIYRPQESNQIQIILMAIMEILTLHVDPVTIGKVAEALRQSPQLKAIEVNSNA